MFNEAKQFLKRWKQDQQGLAWVIGVAVLSLAMTPIIYVPLNMAWEQVLGAVTDNYTFTGNAALSIRVETVLISYMAAFSLLFTVAWAITQAKARKYEP